MNGEDTRSHTSLRFRKLLAAIQQEFDTALANQGASNATIFRPTHEVTLGEGTSKIEEEAQTTSHSKGSGQGQEPNGSRRPSVYANLKLFAEWREEGDRTVPSMHRQRTAELCMSAAGQTDDLLIGVGKYANEGIKKRMTPSEWLRSFPSQWVLTPLQGKRVLWDLLGTVALAWDLFQVPATVFEPPEKSAGWLALGWFTTIYWTCDMLASCFTGYFDRVSTLVMDFRSIVRRYLRTWFIFDLLMVSLDWARIFLSRVDMASKSSRILKVLRFVRTLRMLRLFRSSRMKEVVLALQEHVDSPFLDPVFSMAANAIMIVCGAHFVASAWYGIGLLDDNKSWIVANDMKSKSFAMKYLDTLRMALTVCVGKNLWFQPENIEEAAFILGMQLIGLMVFSTFVGGVTSRLTKIRDIVEQESIQMFHLKQYLKDNRASSVLKERVIHYAEYAHVQHKRCRKKEDVALLGLISGPLHLELETEVHKPYLIINPFFKCYASLSDAATGQVCFSCLQAITLAKNDTLFRGGEASHEMFIVKSGVLACRYAMRGSRATEVIRKGLWFCEAALWVPWTHESKMKAMIEAELIGIDSNKFRECSKCHPKVLALCRSYARQFLEEVLLAPHDCWDLPKQLLHPEEYQDAEFHTAIKEIKHVHPMGYRFAKMITQAEEMSARLIHDESEDEEHNEEYEFEDDEDDREASEDNIWQSSQDVSLEAAKNGSCESAI